MTASYDSTLVSASLIATAPTQVSARFTTVLFATPVDASFDDQVRSYTGTKSVEADKTALTEAVANELKSAFSHPSKNPGKILVGKIEADQAQVVTVTINSTEDGNHAITIGSTEYTFAASGSTDAEIATGLAAAVDADNDVGAVGAANVVTITSSVAGKPFTATATAPAGTAPVVAESTANRSIYTEMSKVLAANPEFQVVVPAKHTELEISRLAQWAAENRRLQYAQMSLAGVLNKTASNLVDAIVGAGYEEHTALVYHSEDDEPAAITHAANRASFDIDTQSVGWAWTRNLSGVAVNSITDTQLQNLRDQYVNVYLKAKGQKAMGPARTLLGRQIKHRMTIDWIDDTIERRVAALVLDRADAGLDLSYDADGFEEISEVIRGVLADAEDANHTRTGNYEDGRPYSLVFTPKLSAIGDDDKGSYRATWTYTIVFKSQLEGVDAQGYGSTDEVYINSIQLALV